MNVMMDHIGATVVGGIVLLSLLAVTLNLQSSSREVVMENIVQTTISDVAASMVSDFRKIGYGVPRNAARISGQTATSITFLADIDNSGSIDTVQYYLGSPSELPGTPNPNDRPLHRVVNGQTMQGSSFGCTSFQMTYYDSLGQVAANASAIRQIAVRIGIQSKAPNGDSYVGSYWQSLIKPMNLSTRYLR